MNTHTPKLVEAGYVRGLMTVTLERLGDAVADAAYDGHAAAAAVVKESVRRAVAEAVKKADRLTAVIAAAAQTERVQTAKAAALEREKAAAAHTHFGGALTAKLNALTWELRAAGGLKDAAELERESAERELKELRDAVLTSAAAAVERDMNARRDAAQAARDKAADALSQTAAVKAVKAELLAAVPVVFGPTGIAPVRTDEDPDPVAADDDTRPPTWTGWRRAGYEDDYGEKDDFTG